MNCRFCGANVDGARDKFVVGRECQTCNFWKRHVETKNDPRAVRAGGVHFWIAPDDERVSTRMTGFGGTAFKIVFNDGREVITRNLWCQGRIPAHFRAELTDNATREIYNAD